jgi:hypothetical protein
MTGKYCPRCLVEMSQIGEHKVFTQPELWLECPICEYIYHKTSTSIISLDELREIKLKSLMNES